MHTLPLAALSLCTLVLPSTAQEDAAARKLATIPADLELSMNFTGPDGSSATDRTRFVFGSGGHFVAYAAWRGGRGVAVLGDTIVGEFDFLHQPVMDATRQHHAFRAGNRVSDTKEEWWAIVDGEPGKAFDWIGEVAVGATGDAAFWEQPGAKIGRDGIYRQGAMVFWFAGKKGKKLQQTRALLPPSFSHDGKTVATVGGNGPLQVLLATTRKQTLQKAKHDVVEDFALSPDGRDTALVVVEGGMPLPPGMPAPPGVEAGKWRVVVGKERHGEDTDGAGTPTWSPDGGQLAFKFVRDGRMGIALAGERPPEAEHEFVGNPVFTPDGDALAFVSCQGGEVPEYARLQGWGDLLAEKGRFALHRRAVRGRATETVVADAPGIRCVTFAPDGRLAWAQKEPEGEAWRVVCGTVRSEPFDEVAGLEFAADGRSLGFGARAGRELWWHVLPLP